MALDLSDGVDADDVREVYEGETASTDALDFWIAAANDLVADRLDASEFGDEELARIQLLVACHFLAAQNPTESEMDAESVSATYEGVSEPDAADADLTETRYGRRAITLDTTGGLAATAEEPFVFETYGAGG